MAVPTDRASLKDYCLRKLGFPVINIEVDDNQVDDRVDEAISWFQQYHMDATTKVYFSVTIDQNMINSMSIPIANTTVANSIIGITRIFPLLSGSADTNNSDSFNIFDLNYQLRLNELYDFTSADYVYFELAQQHIRTLEMLFIGEPPIRYNRYDNTLYVDMKWGSDVVAGSIIVVEAFAVLPENNTLFWNDNWLKEYTTALIKEQWGSNLKKFAGTPLAGGVTLNGQQIYDEAVAEINRLKVELEDKFQSPPEFLVG